MPDNHSPLSKKNGFVIIYSEANQHIHNTIHIFNALSSYVDSSQFFDYASFLSRKSFENKIIVIKIKLSFCNKFFPQIYCCVIITFVIFWKPSFETVQNVSSKRLLLALNNSIFNFMNIVIGSSLQEVQTEPDGKKCTLIIG